MKLAAIFMFVAGQLTPEQSAPACTVPQVPAVVRAQKPVRPAPPSCVDEARNRHTCRPAVINAFNQQMEQYERDFDRYVGDLNDYVVALNRYMEQVSQYTACEREVAGIVGGFIRG